MTVEKLLNNTSLTEEEEKQYFRFIEDSALHTLKKTSLNKDEIQKLIENGDEFQKRIITAVRELSKINQFSEEESESDSGYSSDYKNKGIAEQTNRLRELFPGISYANKNLSEQNLPLNAEGWFAIPRWEKIATTYGEAVQKVFNMIKETRNGAFFNYREKQIGPRYLRQTNKSNKAFQKIGDEQKDYDILIVPAQFGLYHRGRSVRRVREIMNKREFGLGVFAVGIMLLTHPERLQQYEDLWIDCPGDEFSPNNSEFSESPCFKIGEGDVEFGTFWIGQGSEDYGSVSGFISNE